jgi:hypothetical protein
VCLFFWQELQASWFVWGGFFWPSFMSFFVFVARSTPIRRAFRDTRLLVGFAVALWSYRRQPRPCGLTVVGAWPARTEAYFFVSARVGHRSHFLVLAGGGKGFWRLAITGVVFVLHAPAPARISGDRLFVVSVCIFVCCFFLCSLFLRLSVGTQILLICFRA